jgi:NIPSNAP
MKTHLTAALGLLLAGYGIGRAAQPAPAHVYELRTYTAAEGKLDAVNARFRDHTRQIFEKHHIKSVGYWTPSEGPMAGTTLIYLLEHSSREEARKNWAEFSADPEWQKARSESEANGQIVTKVQSVFMTPTDYSPIK